VVTLARAVERLESGSLRVTRVTPDGDEVVEVPCPAVVTVSNELGEPRYPTAARKLAARRMKPRVCSVEELGLTPQDLEPRVRLARQYVPTVQGNCEFVSGDSPAEIADRLVAQLRESGALR
jgi:electron transfer flavoprotein beta subunit